MQNECDCSRVSALISQQFTQHLHVNIYHTSVDVQSMKSNFMTLRCWDCCTDTRREELTDFYQEKTFSSKKKSYMLKLICWQLKQQNTTTFLVPLNLILAAFHWLNVFRGTNWAPGWVGKESSEGGSCWWVYVSLIRPMSPWNLGVTAACESPQIVSRSLEVLSIFGARKWSDCVILLLASTYTFSHNAVIFEIIAENNADFCVVFFAKSHWNIFWKHVHYIFSQTSLFIFTMEAEARTRFYIKQTTTLHLSAITTGIYVSTTPLLKNCRLTSHLCRSDSDLCQNWSRKDSCSSLKE